MKAFRPLLTSELDGFGYDGMPVSLYSPWSSTEAYAAGAIVYVGTWEYIALQANTDVNPTPSTARDTWALYGRINPLKAVDGRTDSPSYSSSSGAYQEYSFRPFALPGQLPFINAVALFNVVGSRVKLSVRDPVGGEVYSVLSQAYDDSIVRDWFEYFHAPFTAKTNHIFTDLIVAGGQTLVVEIQKYAGQVSEVGEILLGQSFWLGETLEGSRLSIQDFSVKQRDEWGGVTIVPRSYAPMHDFSLAIPNSAVRGVRSKLTEMRATPMVFFDEDYGAAQPTMIYGYYRGFDITLKVGEYSYMDLEIEGLV